MYKQNLWKQLLIEHRLKFYSLIISREIQKIISIVSIVTPYLAFFLHCWFLGFFLPSCLYWESFLEITLQDSAIDFHSIFLYRIFYDYFPRFVPVFAGNENRDGFLSVNYVI